MSSTGELFERAVSIMARLRGPGGCPWDREQNFDSIKPYTLEETYEVLEAIDNRDWDELRGELGDLLLHVGFDWPEIGGLFEKLKEETAELKEELRRVPSNQHEPRVAASGKPLVPETMRHRLEEEVGDLFFVLVNIARYLSVDPESALKKTNRKFKRRFQWMEDRLRENARTPQDATMGDLENLWQRAKAQEKQEKSA